MTNPIKSYILLITTGLFCLTTSCSGNNSGDKKSGEVSTMLEAIELGADPQKANVNLQTVSEDENSPTKGRGQWDGNALMYNDDPRHLFWDISTYPNWDIVSEERIPKDMQFAAINEDNNSVVTLVAIPLKDNAITSIWQLPKEVVLKQLVSIQDEAFPGSTNFEPTVEKVQFRNRSAYQITYKSNVPDYRNDETVIIPFQIRMVAMISGDEIIELTVMVPQAVVDKDGSDIFNFLLGKFNFVD